MSLSAHTIAGSLFLCCCSSSSSLLVFLLLLSPLRRCGFDSVPSDIGAFVVAEHARSIGKRVRSVESFFSMRGGGASGGTLASIVNLVSLSTLKRMGNPLLLCIGDQPAAGVVATTKSPVWFKFDSRVKGCVPWTQWR